MGRLLPSSKPTVERSDEPRLLCMDDERTGEVLATLSSETSREVFRAVVEDPKAATDVADDLGVPVQNVAYHLDNLEEAGLIRVVDVHYSEKGQEMEIYGPSEDPLLVFLGSSEDRPGMVSAFKRFSGAIGPVAVLLAVGETLARLLGLED